MSDLYLIAHKVSGAPAFDVAQRIECPECNADHEAQCVECDGLGYWWIISTSGHRAYPYWSYLLERVFNVMFLVDKPPSTMPPDLPDHYPHATHIEAPRASLADRLGITKRPPAAPIVRRI